MRRSITMSLSPLSRPDTCNGWLTTRCANPSSMWKVWLVTSILQRRRSMRRGSRMTRWVSCTLEMERGSSSMVGRTSHWANSWRKSRWRTQRRVVDSEKVSTSKSKRSVRTILFHRRHPFAYLDRWSRSHLCQMLLRPWLAALVKEYCRHSTFRVACESYLPCPSRKPLHLHVRAKATSLCQTSKRAAMAAVTWVNRLYGVAAVCRSWVTRCLKEPYQGFQRAKVVAVVLTDKSRLLTTNVGVITKTWASSASMQGVLWWNQVGFDKQ